MSDIPTILNACELVWRQQSVANASINDMRSELEAHLLDAQTAGKGPESVVGVNIDRFARSWAAAQPVRIVPDTLTDAQTEREQEADRTRTRLYISIGAILAVTVLGLILSPKSAYDGLETWQWIFVGSTFTLLIGEMLTGGFFVLPFGIGAASTSFLSFAEVEPPFLILTFIIVSILALWGLREFAAKDDDIIVPVGANRYLDQTAVVIEPIQGVGTVGRVRFETESWMAVTDTNQFIPAGSVVRINEVRGARFVVTSS